MKIHLPRSRFNSKAEESFIAIWIIQVAVWGSIALSEWLPNPLFVLTRQAIGFMYITFVPGILLLMLLNLDKKHPAETLLYSVGLSISVLMFSGLFMNTVYPLLGNSEPFSPTNTIITLSIITSVLSLVCYWQGRSLSSVMSFSLRDSGFFHSPVALGLCLTPFIAIFSTYLLNFFDNNILQLILIAIFCVICFLIAFDSYVPEGLFPLVILVMGLSLLLRTSLVSSYLTGFDVQIEHQLALSIVQNARWDPAATGSINSMLSVVTLAPIYSLFLKMDLTWVFKVVYPLLFSLVPLGLYFVVQKQSNAKIAFFSSFFFMSFATFYLYMPSLARQEIAELFLVLLILLLIDREIKQIKKTILLLVFGLSLVVSHYSTSYLFMFTLIAAWIIITLRDNVKVQRVFDSTFRKVRRDPPDRTTDNLARGRPSYQKSAISLAFAIFFIISAISWYMYLSASSPFFALVGLGENVANSFSDLANPTHAQGLYVATHTTRSGFLTLINATINYLFQFLIIVGVISCILVKQRETRFDRSFIAFASISLVVLLASMVVPFFAAQLDITRLYHLTLFFLSAFLVIGWIFIVDSSKKILTSIFKKDRILKRKFWPLTVLLILYLLFASGFVYQISDNNSGTITLDNSVDAAHFNNRELATAQWIISVNNQRIAGDMYRLLLINSLKVDQTSVLYILATNSTPTSTSFPGTSIYIPANVSYVFLGTNNINSNRIFTYIVPPNSQSKFGEQGGVFPTGSASLTGLANNQSKIYDNGGANVLYIINKLKYS